MRTRVVLAVLCLVVAAYCYGLAIWNMFDPAQDSLAPAAMGVALTALALQINGRRSGD